MRLRERRQHVADARLRPVGQLGPAVAGVDALPLQPEQHGDRVLDVGREIGLRLRQRRGEVAEAPVVEVEHLVELAALVVVEPAMPPQMVQKVVAAFPVGLERLQPGDALLMPALHLQHVGDGVRGPQVVGRQRHGLAPRLLSHRVVAELLVGEAMAAEHAGEGRQLTAPVPQCGVGLRAHQVGPAVPERIEVVQAEGDQVQRVLVEDLLPVAQRGIDVARHPGRQRLHMRLLAASGAGGKAARLPQLLAGGRQARCIERCHQEVAAQRVPEGEIRIGCEQFARALGRIRAILEEPQHRVVEQARRLGGAGGERKAVQIGRGHASSGWERAD